MNALNKSEAVSVSEEAALEQLLRRRHSCRGFLATPVPETVIERIIEIAQRTASWCNAQPWQVDITRGEGTESFRRLMLAHVEDQPVTDFAWPKAYQGIYGDRRRACGFALYESVGVARGDKEGYRRQMSENYRLFGAPHVAIISSDDGLSTYGAIDCGGFVANFLNAATALGVATIPQAALTVRSDLVRAHFGLPANRRVVCAISFGYADSSHPANGFRTDRALPSEVIRFHDGA